METRELIERLKKLAAKYGMEHYGDMDTVEAIIAALERQLEGQTVRLPMTPTAGTAEGIKGQQP